MELLQIYNSGVYIFTPGLRQDHLETNSKVTEINGKTFSRFKRPWIKSYQKYLAQWHCKVSYFFFSLMALVEQICSVRKSKHSTMSVTKAQSLFLKQVYILSIPLLCPKKTWHEGR